ncbi:MAG: hypothetical protein ACLRZH_15445 [Ruthenibacterium lactatiformans]
MKRIFLRIVPAAQPSRADLALGITGYAPPGGERLEVSLVDAGRPRRFLRGGEFHRGGAFVPPPFLGEEKTESGDFSMSAYWHATRGSGREG